MPMRTLLRKRLSTRRTKTMQQSPALMMVTRPAVTQTRMSCDQLDNLMPRVSSEKGSRRARGSPEGTLVL